LNKSVEIDEILQKHMKLWYIKDVKSPHFTFKTTSTKTYKPGWTKSN